MPRTKPTTRKRSPAVTGPDGEPIPLIIPVPGGQARFCSTVQIPPRKARELEIIMIQAGPLLVQARQANAIAMGNTTLGDMDGVTLRLSADDARLLSELTDVAAWAYLESWTLKHPDGSKRDLPETPDSILDLPGPLYHALTQHAAKLLNARDESGFTIDALGDDIYEADEDTPT